MHYLCNEKLIGGEKKKPQEIYLLGIFKRIFLIGISFLLLCGGLHK